MPIIIYTRKDFSEIIEKIVAVRERRRLYTEKKTKRMDVVDELLTIGINSEKIQAELSCAVGHKLEPASSKSKSKNFQDRMKKILFTLILLSALPSRGFAQDSTFENMKMIFRAYEWNVMRILSITMQI